MRSCLFMAWLGWAGMALAAPNARAPVHKVTSVVRADPRSGRLVRRVAVPARVLRAREIQPRVVAAVEPRSAEPRGEPSSLEAFIEEMAGRYQLDPLLVQSVIDVESGGNPWAVSPKGAQGLMQLMPATARRFDVGNTFNPWQNIEGGVRYLKHLLTLFGNERLALAAYNAGEGAVFRYGNVPPYRETTDYVYRVGKKWGQARKEAERNRPKTPEPGPEPRIQEYTDSVGTVHIETRLAP